jgi:hypothetical protein
MTHGLLLKDVSLRSFIETYVIEVFYWNICHWGLLLKHMSLRSFIETCVIRKTNDKCFNGIHQWHVFQLKRPHDMYYKPRSKWHVFQLKTETCVIEVFYWNMSLRSFIETCVIEVFYWNMCHWGLSLKHVSLRSLIETHKRPQWHMFQ